jgi:hypothetical protein
LYKRTLFVGGTGTFIGQLQIVGFVVNNGQPAPQGFLSGTLTDSTGTDLLDIDHDIAHFSEDLDLEPEVEH